MKAHLRAMQPATSAARPSNYRMSILLTAVENVSIGINEIVIALRTAVAPEIGMGVISSCAIMVS